LFDFHNMIYGQEWEFELVEFLRPEQAFDSLESLREQIMKDIEMAKAKLN
jgi:riboflavin kinase/FMN adenylyltransferase